MNISSSPRLMSLATAILSVSLLASCKVTKERLDEAVFYDGPHFRLKLVRYYENYPLHYSGEVFRIQCSSARTANPGTEMQDPGWVMTGSGAAIGSKSAKEVAEREGHNYHVLGEDILAWTGNGVNVSFDACGGFQSWYPTALPADLIVPAEKPDYCAPKGKADCRHYDFLGDRAPSFEAIRANAQGTVSFLVRSKAFKGNRAMRVQSSDYGKTWTVTAVGQQ
ncbi:MAG TPA: hypothetical protein VGK14_04525 [Novimethylophilus sp.]|jgi:hypothetical protein|uniref:hypothetical protein n=1 Tax=Novimethylophilus sp. TaxID=2137426 RepID=UPI002F40CCD4